MPPDQTLRERFDGHELAIVLSYYDLGALESLRVFPRGSRRSPKVRIKSQRGEFLLKRRAAGQDDPFRVAFAHELQLLLAQRQYPVPGLIGTRDNNSMLHLNGRTCELFNYIHGTRFDRSAAHAQQVGAMLGQLHLHLQNHRPQYQPPSASFHGVPEIDAKMALLAPAIFSVEPHTDRAKVTGTVDALRRAYNDAAQHIDRLNFSAWPRSVVHGDWHPGNLLFRHGQIVGVLDFDSARLEPRVVDVANAALQFSMLMGDPDRPSTWPDGLEENVIRTVLAGYDESSGKRLSTLERASLPWLMIEALIIESIVPIAATGSFARIPGAAFLQMIERKVKWIRPHAEQVMGSRKE
jgi:Ser/Thr protein kinase RdoA (MazF antagonist)